MKILVISAGLMPKRSGGVPLYLIELRHELVLRNHEVIYLDTNCRDDGGKVRITQSGTAPDEYSFFNAGSLLPMNGSMSSPLSDIYASRKVKNCLVAFINTIKPDLIHFQEILCFPLELVSMLRERGHKLLFSAHDYFAVCPTIQLFRHDQRICTLQADELQCHQCVHHWPLSRVAPFTDFAMRIVRRLPRGNRLCLTVVKQVENVFNQAIALTSYSSNSYRTRRLEAISHLNSFHSILCDSKVQKELISQLTQLPNLGQLYTSRLTHGLQRKVPLRVLKTSNTTRFVAININQVVKGRELLLKEFRDLRMEQSNVELHLYGTSGTDANGVFFHKPFADSEYDSILSNMDVGIVPSIWRETYGHVGPEMLMRGIPLIASSAGAMREYVIPDFNGLLFDPNQPGDLKQAMKLLATDSQLLEKLKSNAPDSKQGIVLFSDHVDQMEAVYRELAGRHN